MSPTTTHKQTDDSLKAADAAIRGAEGVDLLPARISNPWWRVCRGAAVVVTCTFQTGVA